MSNRKKIKKRPEHVSPPEQRMLLTSDNKEEVAKMLCYSMASVNEILDKAHAEGYTGVSFPIPP